jgi:hypothetical protein
MRMADIIRRTIFVLCCSALLMAQSGSKTGTSEQQPQPPLTAAQPQVPTAPSQPRDDLSQMRDDLNRMESLNMNMSSEIEFLHDQNLQILLRTNSQMWTVLIRDMRRQLEQEEQRGVAPPAVKK